MIRLNVYRESCTGIELVGSGEYAGDRPPIQDDRKSADKINQTP
jgi:hypothetical protein